MADVAPAAFLTPEESLESNLSSNLSGVPVRQRTQLVPLLPSDVVSSRLLEQLDAVDLIPIASVASLAVVRRTDSGTLTSSPGEVVSAARTVLLSTASLDTVDSEPGTLQLPHGDDLVTGALVIAAAADAFKLAALNDQPVPGVCLTVAADIISGANSKPLSPFRQRVALLAPPNEPAAASSAETPGSKWSGAWARSSGLSTLAAGVNNGNAGSMRGRSKSRWGGLSGGSAKTGMIGRVSMSLTSMVLGNANWLSTAVHAMNDATRSMLRAERKVRNMLPLPWLLAG